MKNNRAGFSLVEVLVSLAIVVFVSSMFSIGFLNYKNASLKSKNSSTVMKQINGVVENIRANIQLYQINFDSVDVDAKLDTKLLPMAWNGDYFGTAASCEQCPGRFGYVIQPSIQTGLFLLTIRVTHTAWDTGYVEYQTFVSIK